MKDFISSLIEGLSTALNGPAVQKQSFESNGVRAKLTTGDGFLKLVIYSSPTEESKPKPETEEELKNRMKCEELRKNFHAYIDTLDSSLFKAITKNCAPGSFKKWSELIDKNDTDPKAMIKAIDEFKTIADATISELVLRLKSKMTTVPKH